MFFSFVSENKMFLTSFSFFVYFIAVNSVFIEVFLYQKSNILDKNYTHTKLNQANGCFKFLIKSI